MNIEKLKQKIINCIEQEGFSFVEVKRGLFFGSDTYLYENDKESGKTASIKLVTFSTNDHEDHLTPFFSANISTELRTKVYKLINEHKDEPSIQLDSLANQ